LSTEQTPEIPSKILFSFGWNSGEGSFDLTISYWIFIFLFGILILFLLYRWLTGGFALRDFEIDEAEIGIGQSKLKFKPNLADKQVAYAIWIELSTRKIGLPIDLDHDVIAEIYDSWYHFFSVTRDLIKGLPVTQVKRKSTQTIINLSVQVLNDGLRPHLTQWQARFRRWYERELKKYDESPGSAVMDPQQIQTAFPKYQELKADLERVNQNLIRYRTKMKELMLKE